MLAYCGRQGQNRPGFFWGKKWPAVQIISRLDNFDPVFFWPGPARPAKVIYDINDKNDICDICNNRSVELSVLINMTK